MLFLVFQIATSAAMLAAYVLLRWSQQAHDEDSPRVRKALRHTIREAHTL